MQFRCNALKRLISEKEMKGNERSFTVSRVCFWLPRASGIGLENPDWRRGRRTGARAGRPLSRPDGCSTRSDQALMLLGYRKPA